MAPHEADARGKMRWIVADGDAGLRVDAWLARQPEVGSRTRAREWIERGKVLRGGVEVTFDRAGERVRAGDEIVAWVDRPGSSRARSRDLVTRRHALRVVLEDASLLVADKPPGLLVEPLPGDRSEVTLRDLVSDHLRTRDALVVHRIDRDTSGLVLFAKNSAAQTALKRQFERRTAERVYIAVLHGHLAEKEGTWKDALVWDRTRLAQRRARPDDDRGKQAISSYRVLEQVGRASVVEITLVTGKRNQIRIQAALRHHPLVGERIYRSSSSEVRGPKSELQGPKSDVRGRRPSRSSEVRGPESEVFPRQALHAARLAFRHPETGKRVEIEAPFPADMRDLIERLRQRRQGQG